MIYLWGIFINLIIFTLRHQTSNKITFDCSVIYHILELFESHASRHVVSKVESMTNCLFFTPCLKSDIKGSCESVFVSFDIELVKMAWQMKSACVKCPTINLQIINCKEHLHYSCRSSLQFWSEEDIYNTIYLLHGTILRRKCNTHFPSLSCKIEIWHHDICFVLVWSVLFCNYEMCLLLS